MRPADLSRRVERRSPAAADPSPPRPGRRPGRLGALSWIALVCAAAVLATVVWGADRQPAGDRTVGEVTRVGVATGDSIPDYLRASRDELARLPNEPGRRRYALVAFSAYLAPDQLVPILGDVAVSQVFGRAPLPGRQTEIVRIPASRIPDDVRAGMVEVAQRKEAEAEEYRDRNAALRGDAAADHDLRQVYVSGAEVAAAEAVAYRAGCSCLYAAVVRAEPEALRTLSDRSGVRAVDPAPEVERLDRTVFLPPLPDQQDVVRSPGDDAIPSAAPPSAAPLPAGEPRATSAISMGPPVAGTGLAGTAVEELTVAGVLSGVARIGFAS